MGANIIFSVEGVDSSSEGEHPGTFQSLLWVKISIGKTQKRFYKPNK